MNTNYETEEEIVRYLLGEMADAERNRFENDYFADDELYDRLELIEEQLIMRYVQDELSTPERERFERAYMSVPSRRKKVELAAELRAAVSHEASAEKTSASIILQRGAAILQSVWKALLAPRAMMPAVQLAFATTFIFVVTYGVWQNLKNAELQQRLSETNEARNALTQEKHDLQQEVSEQRNRIEDMASQVRDEQERRAQAERAFVEQQQSSSPLELVKMEFGLGTARSGSQPEDSDLKVIPQKAKLVQVLLFPESIDRYITFRAILSTVENDHLWSCSELRPSQTSEGKAIVLLIPTDVFTQEDYYILRLSGSNDRKEFREVDSYAFRVMKK